MNGAYELSEFIKHNKLLPKVVFPHSDSPIKPRHFSFVN